MRRRGFLGTLFAPLLAPVRNYERPPQRGEVIEFRLRNRDGNTWATLGPGRLVEMRMRRRLCADGELATEIAAVYRKL